MADIANRFTIQITEYPKKQRQVRMLMMSRGISRATGYTIVTGNNERMKKSQGADTVDGITRVISQDIFKDRYMQVITLSLDSGTTDMYGLDIPTLEQLMWNINDMYFKSYSILMINIIPWQIYTHSHIPDYEADNAAAIFRKYEFMDVSGIYNNHYIKTIVPPYVQVRFNDIGCVPFGAQTEIW